MMKMKMQKKIELYGYSLANSFAIPATFVRIFLAYGIGKRAIKGARSHDTGQKITELRVQLRGQSFVRLTQGLMRKYIRGRFLHI